ncbi:MAG: hypothetical protein P8Z37_03985 [Acidobacteriota bacterium]
MSKIIILSLFLITACNQDDHVASIIPIEDGKPESISPKTEPINVGYAGEDPADIARYLLARGAETARLSPDGKNIAFQYSVTGQPQLWIVKTAGGQEQQLTFGSSSERMLLPETEGGYRVIGDLIADSKIFTYATNELNGLDYDIYTGNTSTGESRMVYKGHYGFFVRAVSPDGIRLVLSETVGEDSDNIFLLNSEEGSLETISQPEPRANHTSGGISWSQNGDFLYFSTNRNREYAALVRYDIAAKDFETIFQTDADVENVHLCGESDRYLTWTVNDDGYSRLQTRILATGEALAVPLLPEGVYHLSCSSLSNLLAIRVNGWDTPGDIYIWNLETGKATKVFQSNLAGLDRKRLIRPQSIHIKARDAVLLQMFTVGRLLNLGLISAPMHNT